MDPMLVPPANFAPVERKLYRSAEPLPVNFTFLSSLRLRTLLWLAVEDPSEALLAYVDENDIEFEHLGLLNDGSNPWDPLTENAITEALLKLLDVTSYPVLVCCSMGRHRTGTVIGCLRKLQDWSFASLIDEYQRFAGGPRGERSNVEVCIEAFNPSVVESALQDRHLSGQQLPTWAVRCSK